MLIYLYIRLTFFKKEIKLKRVDFRCDTTTPVPQVEI